MWCNKIQMSHATNFLDQLLLKQFFVVVGKYVSYQTHRTVLTVQLDDQLCEAMMDAIE